RGGKIVFHHPGRGRRIDIQIIAPGSASIMRINDGVPIAIQRNGVAVEYVLEQRDGTLRWELEFRLPRRSLCEARDCQQKHRVEQAYVFHGLRILAPERGSMVTI